jgi:predicted aconitase
MLDMVACTCHPSYIEKQKIGESGSILAWAKSENLPPKQPQQKGLEV